MSHQMQTAHIQLGILLFDSNEHHNYAIVPPSDHDIAFFCADAGFLGFCFAEADLPSIIESAKTLDKGEQ